MKSSLDNLIAHIEGAAMTDAEKLLFYKNAAQVLLIQYQIKAGLISNLIEFFEKGGGALFHMLANQEITIDIEWPVIRDQLEKILASGQGES